MSSRSTLLFSHWSIEQPEFVPVLARGGVGAYLSSTDRPRFGTHSPKVDGRVSVSGYRAITYAPNI